MTNPIIILILSSHVRYCYNYSNEIEWLLEQSQQLFIAGYLNTKSASKNIIKNGKHS